nr:alkaline phosphatase family protein [Streptomyces sp. H021]
MDTPNPDPGEEYQHVNTQLFGVIDPADNRGVLAEDMAAPFNTPPPGRPPTMDGFVTDYISAFTAEIGRQPKYDEYAQIMAGYTPDQMPVLSTLARGFATFDHRFAEVPSQTFTNRSFFNAASASGFVVNAPYPTFPLHNTAETIFERLEAAGLTWRVYGDAPSPLPFTGLIHAARLRERFATHFVATDRFLEDAAAGTLPAYSFIEPNLWHGHNDMHPPESALIQGYPLRHALLPAGRREATGGGLQRRPYVEFTGGFERAQHAAGGRFRRARRHLRPRLPAHRRPAGPRRVGRADGLRLRPARRPPDRPRDLRLAARPDRRQRRPPPHLGNPHAARTPEPEPASTEPPAPESGTPRRQPPC